MKQAWWFDHHYGREGGNIMKKLSLAVLTVSIAVGVAANAQLPGKLMKDAEKALSAAPDSQGEMAGEPQAGDQAGPRPPARKDADRKYPPGVSFSSLLNGIQLLAKNGQFRLENVQGTFIPDDCKEGYTVLRTADGKELHQIDWHVQPLKKPYSLLATYKITDLSSGQSQGGGGIDLGTPGDYVLDFYLPTERFYTFPFSVAKMGGDDPFGAGHCFTLNGDWQDYGYLFYRDADPDQSLQWKVWLRNDGCEEKPIKVRIEITRDQGGELVCTSRENTTHSCQPKWTRIEFDMVFPEGKDVPHGTYFKAKDLLATDGAYTLTMKLDDQPYGTWKFAVKDGKLQYTGRTLRESADPLTFIEGGRDAWWYAKQK
jgi:hypothetical protein